MIKISRLADYAVVVLATLLKGDGQPTSAASVSGASGLPEPTVAKVLKLLASGGIVASTRGAGGGYALSKTAEQINIADVILAVDGPVVVTPCVEGREGACDYASGCPIHGRWDGVNAAVRGALQSVTLADMMPECKKAAA